MGEQARRAVYVALGAVDWTVQHARQAYAELAQRGETVLGSEGGGQFGSAEQLPIADYDTLTVSQITPKLSGLSQRELDRVADYEHAHQARSTVLGRIEDLRGQHP